MKKIVLIIVLSFTSFTLGFEGLVFLDTLSDNTWIKLPEQNSLVKSLLGTEAVLHTNITVDCDSHKVYYYGSDTHGSDYHNNLIFSFELDSSHSRCCPAHRSECVYWKSH